MKTPTAEQIMTMPKEDLDAVNRKLAMKFATHVVGAIFIRTTLTGVLTVLAKKAIIEAAKRA